MATLPAIPEVLVRRLYKASRIALRARLLKESLREEILKLLPPGFLRGRSASIPFGDLVLTFSKRVSVGTDWDLVLKTFCPEALLKVEEAKRLARSGKRHPEWVSRSSDIAVTAAPQKKKGAVA